MLWLEADRRGGRAGQTGSYTAAFNPNFLSDLRARRGERLNAFSDYRKARDPDGLFYNAYLKQLLEG